MPTSPLIGVSAGRVPAGNRTLDGADRDYSRAVQIAGGTPVILPATTGTDLRALVGRIDGLLLSGGGDVDPARYGAAPAPETGGVDHDRDEVELEMLAAALDRGIPVLGVCRGCQVVNVALGGTLHQHVPGVTDLDHLHREPRDWLAHTVSVEKGSRLHEVVGLEEMEVNSIHHQAVQRLGRSLRAVACAPDGLVEAIEDPHRPLLAVQWHPESLVPAAPHLALFRWLTGAAA
ncbi:MAG TPA: gamma-glutamyl-gamma-aminobutyrate hydrolase family protein [Acidimicrobiales bacterium]|nr:gamma-glutamyl-gamma-aminobutyrate hydrolase family protein [Acidimicrobiales bacterium]